jgi:tight adherence protein B
VTPILLAAAAASGVYLLFTAVAFGWRGIGTGGPTPNPTAARRRRTQEWLVHAGLGDVRLRDLAAVTGALFVLGCLGAWAVFGGVLPAVLIGLFAATWPLASYRLRRRANRSSAMEAWPRILEEVRILTSSLGRSVPQALFEAGKRAPVELRPAFAAAQREWLLSTDFGRTMTVLKAGLADPTADAVCETLLVAHQVGGSDLDQRLEALIVDRVQDTQGRKDAKAKQAGARFARRFVLVVPAGMALAGMSVGTGRDAYRSGSGQALVAAAVLLVAVCWLWAGRIMRLPEEERVFHG